MCYGRIVFFETVCGHLIPMSRVVRAFPTIKGDVINVRVSEKTPEDGWETVYREEWERARERAEG